MLNAKEARIQMQENKISNAIGTIEKQIKKAIAKGRDYIILAGVINETVAQMLEHLGYKVEEQARRTKISW